jgi:predicted small integral membrane protein
MAWMAWTWPTAAFFAGIFTLLAAMTLLQQSRPTKLRKGVLPFTTTRGDRLFLGLLTAGYLHLGWLALSDAAVWLATLVSVLVIAALLRWG